MFVIAFLIILSYIYTEETNFTIFANSHFIFYLNETELKKDPIKQIPLNAVRFNYTFNTSLNRVYSIKVTSNTVNYGNTTFKLYISDKTISSNKWRCLSLNKSSSNQSANNITYTNNSNTDFNKEPLDWTKYDFDDTNWNFAKENVEIEYSNIIRDYLPKYNKTNQICSFKNETIINQNIVDITNITRDDCLDIEKLCMRNSKFIYSPDGPNSILLCRYKYEDSNFLKIDILLLINLLFIFIL